MKENWEVINRQSHDYKSGFLDGYRENQKNELERLHSLIHAVNSVLPIERQYVIKTDPEIVEQVPDELDEWVKKHMRERSEMGLYPMTPLIEEYCRGNKRNGIE